MLLITIMIKYSLNNVELHIRRGMLVSVFGTISSFSSLCCISITVIQVCILLVIGKVGCGKSTLLMSLIGELHKVYG